MACGKKRVRKLLENHKAPRIAKTSKYERDDPSVKNHWKNVIKEMEASYKEDKFWEKTANHVNELVGDVIFERIRNIFNLPPKPVEYHMNDEIFSITSSNEYFPTDERKSTATAAVGTSFPNSISTDEKESIQDVEHEDLLSDSTDTNLSSEQSSFYRTNLLTDVSLLNIKIASTTKSGSNIPSKYLYKSLSKNGKSKQRLSPAGGSSEIYSSRDDLVVHAGDFIMRERKHHPQNPYHEMLYCKESETDMIQWKSNYKTKKDEINMSDKFSQNIEKRTKKIATEFLEWWSSIGSDEYRSEIKKPKDIEALFQTWFDEHASRGLVVDRKILPCVLTSIANHSCAFEKSCEGVLKTEILKDIEAEAIPAKTIAFNASLPKNIKHIPPWNNTEKLWQRVHVPEDLRSMACVWGDIRHLRSTKSFEAWLRKRPSLPIPPIFEPQKPAANMKQVFAVPVSSNTANTDTEPTIPFSNVNIELKDALAKLIEH